MLENGTVAEIKDNLLNHLLWLPQRKDVERVKGSFSQEFDAVAPAEIVNFITRGVLGAWGCSVNGTAEFSPHYPVIRVYFMSKREHHAVVTKAIRAARRARLVLFNIEKQQDGGYVAFLRVDA